MRCGLEDEVVVFILLRAATYATLFIGLFLLFLPARLVSWSGVAQPSTIGATQLAGIALGIGGGLLALSCVAFFVLVGRGTPAPFDPPRRLVTRGPYRLVRNPMFLGGGKPTEQGVGESLFQQAKILKETGRAAI